VRELQANGDFTKPNNKPCQEFRAGDAFVRLGSSSVRWNRAEADAALNCAMVVRKNNGGERALRSSWG
jgi:hypothetical protein